MKSHRSRTRLGASVAAGLSAALAFGSLVATPAFAAPAEPAPASTEISVDDAVFAWSLNQETGNRSYSGAYNVLSAGAIAKSDASDTIAESEWRATDGNVTIQKPDAEGNYSTATWAGTKTDPTGATITSPTAGRYTGNRVSISGGTGSYDPATDSADIQWHGDFTVAYYGGLTQFTVSDPSLTVTSGQGAVVGTLSGYGTSMEDSSAFTELPAEEAQIAVFTVPVDVTADGIVIAPDYAGVQLTLPEGATAQSTTGANWGAFPQEFVDYQLGTGQASYWYSSGGAADAAKVAQPITIAFPESDPDPGTSGPGTSEPGATPITSATVEFGFNDVHQGASPAGGCNYFVAGKVQGLGSDYRSIDGDVFVVKKHADGSSEVVSVGTRCTPAEGSDLIDQRFLFTEGTGSTSTDGSTDIRWSGAGTVNAYGGLVSWYFENPRLVLDAEGDGSITARVGGFGSSMDDPTVKVPLDPRENVEIATVRGATIVDGRLTIDPVWKNVDYFPLTDAQDPTSARSTTSAIPQAAKDANPNWGSWPESFVDFQYATGLSSYWHTSGLTADPLKPPMPIDVAFEGSAPDYGVLFTKEPVSATLSEGDDVTFEAEAIGQSGTPTLQWQAKKADGDWADLDGETDDELALTGVTVADWNGAFVRAVATLGDRTATSVAATLSVTASAAPVFTTQPTDVSALVDQSAYFQVEVTGYPAPTYQWQRQLPGGEWENVASDGTYSWYNLYPITLADDGTGIRVIATNATGSVTSDEVHLSVSTLPATITAQPKSLTVFEGGSGWLAAWIDGAPYPRFQWERSTDGTTWEQVPGAIDNVLDFGLITPEIASYSYRLTATNGLASVVTDAATVTILPTSDTPIFVTPGENLDPAVDNTLRFALGKLPALPQGASGLFHIGVVEKSVWQPGDDPIDYSSFVPLAVGNYSAGDLSFATGEIVVPAGSLDPAKEYGVAMMFEPRRGSDALPQFDLYVPITVAQPAVPTVTVSKTSGLDPNGETITVTGSGFLPHAPDTDGAGQPLSGFGGAYVVFGKFADAWQPSAGAPSSARPGIDIRWGVHAADLETIGGASRGAIEITADGTFETTLTVKSGAFDKEGSYGVYTYAGGGAIYAPFETANPVTLNEAAPAVTAQPSGLAVPATPAAGDPVALFTVGVTGAPAPTVQWQSKAVDGDWADVAGATSTTLALPYAAGDDGVSVRAVVANGLGSVTSDAAVLTVTPDPVDPVDPVEPSAPLIPLTDEELAAAPQGTVSILGIDGDVVTISVGTEHAGSFVGTEVHSAPAFLGWSAVSSAGTTTATLPADLPAGEHHLVVRAADGSVIGWAVFTAADETVVTPIDPGETRPAGGSGAVALSDTGFEAAGWLAGALFLLVAGAGAVAIRRVRRS
ncbi:immunoglobulin domain-containing family protein [Herbiconiux ginsengi]|uniref:Immunoglobulin I-set domain-containing protein n=1 Tax=Herbiconiux ginsengi TaxID=381665 RepID=A0A1H3N0G0_9MICO|nr:hypothetical protein [Herbiconiux ginsengi]SDY82244.1 Immunoglobulin I-set domain-containing protein [Herbiconiux ginsengi]